MEINKEKIMKHVERMKLLETRLYNDGSYVDSNIVSIAIDIIEQLMKDEKQAIIKS